MGFDYFLCLILPCLILPVVLPHDRHGIGEGHGPSSDGRHRHTVPV